MTIELATFQRTAETRRAAPTPMMAPVMVWVVETGSPSQVAMNSVRAAGLGAEALHRRQLGDPRAHGAHDPPAAHQGAQPHRRLAEITTQNGTWNSLPRCHANRAVPR